jgi:hypothetical protein
VGVEYVDFAPGSSAAAGHGVIQFLRLSRPLRYRLVVYTMYVDRYSLEGLDEACRART